ncbi:MAG: NifU family protein [Gemmatimonadetes bacterium]|jgi:Fe/S biogenesis protein NfuA|nr:NifU family protein [Gemmatimonadota bacterium]MCH8810385.1 NifU family protein [Gemmatimonadota bacterium]
MITLTDGAREVVRSYMDQSDGEFTALRISIAGGTPLSPNFELTLVGPDDIRESEQKVDVGDVTIVIEEEFRPRLEGATVDFVQRVNESGFEVKLAKTVKLPTLDGPLADRIKTVLDAEINPAIASHGGSITLVGVEGTEIYLEMGGGCQGCAMSRMTLRQGVERMVRQAVPEVTVIHDVTDHSSGENPFFEGPAV